MKNNQSKPNSLLTKLMLTAVFVSTQVLTLCAQDKIYLKNNSLLDASVKEISDTDIKYKKADNPDGPLYSAKREDVLIIVYKNGTVEKINEAVTPAALATVPAAVTSTAPANNAEPPKQATPENKENEALSSIYHIQSVANSSFSMFGFGGGFDLRCGKNSKWYLFADVNYLSDFEYYEILEMPFGLVYKVPSGKNGAWNFGAGAMYSDLGVTYIDYDGYEYTESYSSVNFTAKLGYNTKGVSLGHTQTFPPASSISELISNHQTKNK